MDPKVVTRNEKKIIGVETRTSNQLEVHQSTAQIPRAWSRFTNNQILEQIPNKAHNNIIVGLYTNYESDQNGKYSFIIGTEVTTLDTIPQDMVGTTAPSAKYLEFHFEGSTPAMVTDAWQQIWKYFSDNTEYQRTFSNDFEVYDSKHPGQVDIFIAVK